MRRLLNECVFAKLGKHLSSHDCTTVTRAGLSGYENGELLRKAEELGFDVLLTVDQNLPYQQRIEGRRIAVLILIAASNQIQDLLPKFVDHKLLYRRAKTGACSSARIAGATCRSDTTRSTAPTRIASLSIPKTTQLASSCAMVLAPTRFSRSIPCAPSAPISVRMAATPQCADDRPRIPLKITLAMKTIKQISNASFFLSTTIFVEATNTSPFFCM